MDMTGEQRIPTDRETVWKALNDADILRTCIPGCQKLVKESDTDMTAIAVIKVGPISARFQGKVTLSDLDPPNGYRITGEGQGGVAGHAKGGAVVRLTEDGGETILHYDVSAQVGGRLAQLGGRMIDATARSMSAAFFKKFAEELEARRGGKVVDLTAPPPDMAEADVAMPRQSPPAPAAESVSGSVWPWVLSGMLLGSLITGIFGLPLMKGAFDTATFAPLFLVAVFLSLLQGYLLGRGRPA
ncbi:MAG TPA: carbon monoxide dehydrogenase subunit G [Sphingobium sp.]|uniref:SRPBCC family protein n=1 Tax=Novosphingobium sp. TaxID=1874826 RepID=UPI002B5FEF96|nr:carbon monoxide dehydrogenase subunit G [Sphingobium sp.]